MRARPGERLWRAAAALGIVAGLGWSSVEPVRVTAEREPWLTPKALVELLTDPKAAVVGQTRYFTSACFGPNPVGKEDFLQPLDWWGSRREIGRDNVCEFGFNPDGTGQPTGRYTVGSLDGLPVYYIVPPEAFTGRSGGGKLVLSEVSLIVDPAPYGGWESLGFIVVSADGVTYRGGAADVFRPGGRLSSLDGTKTIVLPTNEQNIFKPEDNGGNYGFAHFPLVIAQHELTFGFTGSPKDGPPPRIYFGVRVDQWDPRVLAKASNQMSDQEQRELAAEYDQRFSGGNWLAEIAKMEQDAAVNYPEIGLKPKEEANFEFSAEPGATLSSVEVAMWPQNNTGNRQILEINPDIYIDGRRVYAGTGFEDLGGQAFYSGGQNPLGVFFPIDHDGYLARRYFGSGPVIADGKVTIRLKNPDVGTAIKLKAAVKVIAP